MSVSLFGYLFLSFFEAHKERMIFVFIFFAHACHSRISLFFLLVMEIETFLLDKMCFYGLLRPSLGGKFAARPKPASRDGENLCCKDSFLFCLRVKNIKRTCSPHSTLFSLKLDVLATIFNAIIYE